MGGQDSENRKLFKLYLLPQAPNPEGMKRISYLNYCGLRDRADESSEEIGMRTKGKKALSKF